MVMDLRQAALGILATLSFDLPPVAAALLLVALASAVALILQILLFASARRMLDRDGWRRYREVLERTRWVVRLALAMAATTRVLPALWLNPEAQNLARHALIVAFVVTLGWAMILSVRTIADISLRRLGPDLEENFAGRSKATRIRLFARATIGATALLTLIAAAITFDDVRQHGFSILASAGAAGIVLGLAARPILSNLIAGLQIAITQPIRIEDVVVVEGEWGWIEDIGATYVVVRVWDWRRLVLPLTYFTEHPFQNWTRDSAKVIGTVSWRVDWRVPIPAMRQQLMDVLAGSALWDGQVANLQVVDATGETIELRALMSARNSRQAWDLRCAVREALVVWIQEHHADALPRLRVEGATRSAA